MHARLLALTLPLLSIPAEAKTLRLFIVTGESNALGTVGTTDLTMRSRPPGQHAAEHAGGVPFFWDNLANATTSGDAALGASSGWTILGAQTGGYHAGNDDHWGPEIGFSRLLWDTGYRDFGIIKAARGDGGNTFWLKGSTDDHMYQKITATVQAATTSLPAGYDDYEISGVLYVQGESNSTAEASAAGTRFSTLLSNLSADLPHATALKGVFGEIAGTGTNRDTTRTNQKSLADSRADIGYAESTGLTLQNEDGQSLHDDADSELLLGERMAAEMIGTGATGTTPMPAWSQLYGWFLADHGAAFDSSGAVQRWGNLVDGSAVHDLTRRVAGLTYRRPVTLAGGGVREVLRFDGSNDLWANSTEFGPLTSARSVAVLCQVTGTGDGFLFDGSTSSGRTRVQIRSGKWQAGVATSSAAWNGAETDTATRQTTVWQRHVFTFEPFDAGSGNIDTRIRHYVNGVEIANIVDADATNLGGLILGSNGGSPFSRLSCDIAEVAVFSKTLDASEVATLDSAWSSRWNNPGPPPFAAAVSQTPATVARFGRSELLHLSVDCPAAGSTTLQKVRLTLAPGTRRNIQSVHLLGTGLTTVTNPSTASLADVSLPSSDTLDLTCSSSLLEGRNHFSVVIVPKRRALLGSTLDAKIDSITVSGNPSGTMEPTNADPAGALTLGLVPSFTDIRRSGQDAVNTYRIPGIVSDTHGVLHAVFDIRYDSSADLPANVDVGYMRSTDGGATWSPMKAIMDFDASIPGSSGNGVGDPCILHDPVTDTIWVAALWSFGNHAYNGSGAGTAITQSGQYVLTKSTDGGNTWSAPINITAEVKDDINWRLVFQGPGHGFAMRNGTLVFPSQYRDASGTVRTCSVFSSDHGATWDFGSSVPTSSPQTNENTACELDDGRLLFSMRTPSGSNGQRAWARYTPGGATPMKDGTWGSLFRLSSVPDPVCQGSVIQWASKLAGQPRELILFGNPASSSTRTNFTLRVSADAGASWPASRQLYAGSAAYSSICILPDRSIGILFEKDDYSLITFARVEEEWLLNPAIDSDGDGMPDAWETLNGTNPSVNDASGDPDGDGQGNLQEHLAGTDPLAKSSVLVLTSQAVTPGGLDVSWASVPGRTYRIEESMDLMTWATDTADVTATSTTSSTMISTGPEKKFVRVKALR
ncbi:exo-alpha-sialidase [Luteolibacter ambystomatis]|uniref:exo-alpha-sialidase n=1 Tax=Luteolibacter ambystomatis TaxID=2824561 RepID=A0A975PFG1_9BACT|nr:exo-alpha-sialidase [Luteolibacter ambystomatis]QUE51582.1 exo-alpha-sialidase [Luteolibacter ambystomatis]